MSRAIRYGWSRFPVELGVGKGQVAGFLTGIGAGVGLLTHGLWQLAAAVVLLIGAWLTMRAWAWAESHRPSRMPTFPAEADDPEGSGPFGY